MDIRDFYNTYQHHQPGLLCSKREYAVLVPLVEAEQGLCLLYEKNGTRRGRAHREGKA